jgi:hypothetical protein
MSVSLHPGVGTYKSTGAVTEQCITKTTKPTCCKEQSPPLDGVSGGDLLRLQLAFQPPLLSCNLLSDLVLTLLDFGALTGDWVVAGIHLVHVPGCRIHVVLLG